MKVEKDVLLENLDHFLRQLLKQLSLDVQFRLEPEDTVVNIRLHGRDAAIVLSNNARVLYALNHLVNQIFFKKSSDGYNFVVDCNEYRATRVLELQLLAQKAAEKVKLSGTPFPLQSMPATERRVIHLALAQDGAVKTMSEGSGEYRRVVILPAK